MHDAQTTVFTLKFYVGMLLAILLGVSCFYIAALFTDEWHHTPWPAIINHIGVAFIAGAGIALFEKLVVHRHIFHQLRELVGIRDSIASAGLEGVHSAGADNALSTIIRGSKRLRVVINYGGKWLAGNRANDFHTRFADPDARTEIYLLDPDGAYLPLLAAKQSDLPEKLRAKVNETMQTFVKFYEEGGHQGELRIYYITDYPTYSLYLGDDQVVISLYPISGREKRKPSVPQFHFSRLAERSPPFEFFEEDVEKLAHSPGKRQVYPTPGGIGNGAMPPASAARAAHADGLTTNLDPSKGGDGTGSIG
jgi:hypothetical protein